MMVWAFAVLLLWPIVGWAGEAKPPSLDAIRQVVREELQAWSAKQSRICAGLSYRECSEAVSEWMALAAEQQPSLKHYTGDKPICSGLTIEECNVVLRAVRDFRKGLRHEPGR